MKKLIVPGMLTCLLLLGGCGGTGEDKKSGELPADQTASPTDAAPATPSRGEYVSTTPPKSERENERAEDRDRGRDRPAQPPESDRDADRSSDREVSEMEEYRSENDRDVKGRRGPERSADRGERPAADPRERAPAAPPLVAAFPDAPGEVGLGEGDIIPEIEGEDTEGVSFKLSDYQGTVIMLDFWGDW